MRKTGLTGMVLALFGGGGIAAADIPDPPGTIGAVESSTAEAGAVDAVAEAYLRPPLAIASRRHVEVDERASWVVVRGLGTDRALRRLDPVVADWDDAGIVLVQLWYGRDRGVAVAMGSGADHHVVGLYEVTGPLPDGMRRRTDGAPG